MMRLVKNGLMFGNLVEVSSSALVGRYNRALKHLINKETALTEFHIDISGYSPEIGAEFEDQFYLNPKGCNQQFILLTTDQKYAPLLNAQFSTSRSILRHYIDENEDQLFALTAREAVAGELMDSIFEVNAPRDLFEINDIHIDADTIQQHVAEAKDLETHIDRFLNEDDAWWDDVLIAQMIELAKRTGNIRHNPVHLKTDTYRQGNYYTDLFGGIYIFRDVDKPTVIARQRVDGLSDFPVENILTFEDRDEIAQFLYDHGLDEPITTAPSDRVAAIISQKIDFIAISTIADLGYDLSDLTRPQIRQLSRKYANQMPPAFDGLMQIARWINSGGRSPRLRPEHPAYFYALRSAHHDDKDLVNMLLSELSPLDFRQLFICHKAAFYDAYRTWSETKKEYVSEFLAQEYAMDKAGAREALFGSEPAMAEPKTQQEEKGVKSPWGVPEFKDGKSDMDIVKEEFEKRRGKRKKRGLRDELDWDKKKYKNRGKDRKGRRR